MRQRRTPTAIALAVLFLLLPARGFAQSVNTVDTLTLARESHPSIGEVLDKEPGVAKRSFGPRSARPVVRGFDGDRALVTMDGASTGSLGYSDYAHDELEGASVGTHFANKDFMYRGVFDQKKTGRFTGSWGFSGLHRDYISTGVETLAPPTVQNNFAAFGLQEIDFERVRFQLGRRVEHNVYTPDGLIDRSFTGFSGAAGARFALWKEGAFVANYTHSYRAPALEELYNDGPHTGNLTFEIGNPLLRPEVNDGVDFSLRHASKRVRGKANFYLYEIKNFVFLALTGAIRENLIEARYDQADSLFKGTEMSLDVAAHETLWLNFGFDYVF